MHRVLFGAETMAGQGRFWMRQLDRKELEFELTWLRAVEGEVVRTLIELRDLETDELGVVRFVSKPDGTIEQWAWIPESRRLRRYGGIQPRDPFLASEFTYEDLGLILSGERREGEARLTRRDGTATVTVESGPYHYYGRVVTELDRGSSRPLRVDFYDFTGAPVREERFDEVREIEGKRLATRISIRDLSTGEASRLEFSDVRFPEASDLIRDNRTLERVLRTHDRIAPLLLVGGAEADEASAGGSPLARLSGP